MMKLMVWTIEICTTCEGDFSNSTRRLQIKISVIPGSSNAKAGATAVMTASSLQNSRNARGLKIGCTYENGGKCLTGWVTPQKTAKVLLILRSKTTGT